jgi:predicted MFS family arabinose efflux permease
VRNPQVVNDLKTRLWNRDFAILWLGLAQSYLGDAFLSIGIMWLALETTGSPAAGASIVALGGLPKLLGPLAGTIVDRSNKRSLMIWSDLIRGALLVSLFFLHQAGFLRVWHLYGLAVVLGALGVFYGPALQVMLPTLVPDSRLPAANGILQTTLQGSMILGASLAGVFLALFGAAFALLLDGLSFLIAGFMLYLVRFSPGLLRPASLAVGEVLKDMVEGFRFILASREVLALTGLAFFINFMLSPVNVILPVFSKEVLGGGVTGFGFLASAIAGGILLGNALVGVAGDRLPFAWSILVGLIGMTAALGGLSVVPILLEAAVLTAALGAMVPFIQIPLVTRLQRVVHQDYKGRVFATLQSVVTLSIPLAAAVAGQALIALPVAVVFRVGALGVFIVAMSWLVWGVRGRRLTAAGMSEE